MPNQNWIQILVVLVMILGPAFGKMLQVAQKKAAENKRRAAIEKRREMELRTGRDASGATIRAQSSAPARAPEPEPEPNRAVLLEEIARRRQEQIEAMRRRAGSGAGSSTPTARPTSAPAGQPRAGAPARREPMARPAPEPQRVQRPQPASRAPGPKPKKPARPAPDRDRRPSTGAAPAGGSRSANEPTLPFAAAASRPTSASSRDKSAPIVAARPSAGQTILGPAGQRGSAWRRAIIMNEILSRPMADRPE